MMRGKEEGERRQNGGEEEQEKTVTVPLRSFILHFLTLLVSTAAL